MSTLPDTAVLVTGLDGAGRLTFRDASRSELLTEALMWGEYFGVRMRPEYSSGAPAEWFGAVGEFVGHVVAEAMRRVRRGEDAVARDLLSSVGERFALGALGSWDAPGGVTVRTAGVASQEERELAGALVNLVTDSVAHVRNREHWWLE